MRLDVEKLEALRAWGEQLRQAEGEELAATGRAILMLVEEIDHLTIELWHARLHPSVAEPRTNDKSAEDMQEPLASSLQSRLRRAVRRHSESATPERAETADAEADTATSAQTWIEGLRRQK
jgi:hypothetical protein